MSDMLGNVWEWTLTEWLEPRRLKKGERRNISEEFVAPHPDQRKLVAKGGSFVDSLEGEFNLPVRTSSRSVVSCKCLTFVCSSTLHQCMLLLLKETTRRSRFHGERGLPLRS